MDSPKQPFPRKMFLPLVLAGSLLLSGTEATWEHRHESDNQKATAEDMLHTLQQEMENVRNVEDYVLKAKAQSPQMSATNYSYVTITNFVTLTNYVTVTNFLSSPR